jgi:LysM repeat protein
LFLAAGFLLTGCVATTKQLETFETDVGRRDAWTEERLLQFDMQVDALSTENENLRRRLDNLTDRLSTMDDALTHQVSDLGDEVASDISKMSREVAHDISKLSRHNEALTEGLSRVAGRAEGMARQREEDRSALIGRMEIILEEVLQENARLSERLAKIESSAFTFGRFHRVAPGETVAAIAHRYRVSIEEIIRANDLQNADRIQVGEELLIPGVSK